jgi:hypothetical protein
MKTRTILIAGVGIGVGYLIYRGIKKSIDNTGEKQDVKDVTSDIKTFQKQGQTLSHTEGSYSSFASQILQACGGYGTDEESIYRVFRQIKKNIDYAKLFSTFGVRTIPCDMFSRPFDNCGKGNLVEILTSELDDKEINKINDILKSNGVTYRL